MIGILAYGAYIPRLRLQRSVIATANAWFNPALKGLAKGEKAISNWDEDVITMAVEAGRDCLSGFARENVESVVLSSTTAPNADRLNAGIVKEALNLVDQTGAQDTGGSQRAGTSALIQALRGASVAGPSLCIAAEKRKARAGSEAEMTIGDAAAALLIGKGEAIARFLGAHSVTADFVDHFRAAGEAFDYGWESRWVRDEGYSKILLQAAREGLAKFSLNADSVDHFIVPIAAKGVAEGLAKKLGIKPEAIRDPFARTIGDAGVAHASLMLVDALERAKSGDHIIVTGFGQGADFLAFQVTEAIASLPKRNGVSGWLARRKPEENYIKYLSFNGLLDLEKGMRAETDFKQPLTALYRNRKTVLGLVGGRCTKTGTVQFPRTDISVNRNDHAIGTQEDYPLAERTARILTYTADNLTYSPDPPAYYGMIEFDEGGRMMAEFADAEAASIEVGREVRMMFRIKSTDEIRGFTKYFWKAVPVAE